MASGAKSLITDSTAVTQHTIPWMNDLRSLQQRDPTCETHFLCDWHLGRKHRLVFDITMRLQVILLPAPKLQTSLHLFSKPNTPAVIQCFILPHFLLSSSDFIPPVEAAKWMCEVAWCSELPGVYFPCLPNLQTAAASLTTAWRDVC